MALSKLRSVKHEIRIVGVDDGGFASVDLKKIYLIGVVFRGGDWLDGVLKAKVEVNGFDATAKTLKMIRSSTHYGQIRLLMLSGILFGKSNIVDVQQLSKRLRRPIIVLMLEPLKELERRLKGSPFENEKTKLLKMFGEPVRLEYDRNKFVYVYLYGIDEIDAKEVMNIACRVGGLPEPLRVARLIASALQST